MCVAVHDHNLKGLVPYSWIVWKKTLILRLGANKGKKIPQKNKTSNQCLNELVTSLELA